MRTLAAADIVSVWELGQRRVDWHRALVVLAPALPRMKPSELSALTIGQRNAYLFALRQRVIGPVMNALVNCSICREPLEFEQRVDEVLQGYQPPVRREFEFTDGVFVVRYRLLTSEDLACAGSGLDVSSAKGTLISRAVVEAFRHGSPVSAADLPGDVVGALGEHMAERDPLSSVAVPLACAACGHVWAAPLDIVSFLWAELEVQANLAFEDVVSLARAYGWSESEILLMSPTRRQYYLRAIE